MLLFGQDFTVARLGALRLWADRGLVHCEDGTNNSYRSMSVRSALHRVAALSDMLGNPSRSRESELDRAKRGEIQEFIDRMCEVIRKAQEQGMPGDPSAVAAYKRARPTVIALSAAEFDKAQL